MTRLFTAYDQSRKTIAVLASLTLIVLLAVPAQALVKSPPEKGLLPNGLRVVVVQDRTLPLVAAVLLVNVGEFATVPSPAGLAGVLPALAQKADTASASRSRIDADLEAAGGLTSVAAMPLGQAISCQGPAESLDVMLHYLAQTGFQLQPDAKTLEEAKATALRSYSDRRAYPLSSGHLGRQAWRLLFPDSDRAKAIDASEAEIAAVTLDGVTRYLRDWFVPNNAVLVIVGDVDIETVFRRSMSVFGGIKAGITECPVVKVTAEEPVVGKRKEHRDFLDIKTSQVVIAFEAPGIEDRDYPAVCLWESALSEANEARLARSFSSRFPELRHIAASCWPGKRYSLFVVSFETSETDIDRYVSSLLGMLSTLWVTPPQPDELRRLIAIKGTQVEQNRETRLGYAFELAAYEMAKDFSLAQAYVAGLSKVTPEDMQRAAQRVFSSSRYAVAVAQPEACRQKTERSGRTDTLPNGLQVVVKPNHGADLAAVAMRIGVGPACDPDGREGLSAVAAAILQDAIEKSHGPAGFGRQLDEIGGGIEFMRMPANLLVVGHCQGGKLPALLDIMKRIVFQPELTETALNAGLERARGASLADEGASQQLLHEFFAGAYAGTYVARPMTGIAATASFTLKEVADLHARYFVPANVKLSVVGQFSADQTMGRVREAFAGLPSGAANAHPPLAKEFGQPLPSVVERQVAVIPPKGSALIGVGYRYPSTLDLIGSGTTSLDFAAIATAFEILTWSRNGLVRRELAQRGLFEDFVFIRNIFNADMSYGFFVVRVPAAKADEARTALKEILLNATQREVSEDEVKSAVRIMQAAFLSAFEACVQQARMLAIVMQEGQSYAEFFETVTRMYQSLRQADVKAAASKYFKTFHVVYTAPRP